MAITSSQLQRGWNVIATLTDSAPLQFQAEQPLRLIRVFEYGNAVVSYLGIAGRTVTFSATTADGIQKHVAATNTDSFGNVTFSMRNTFRSQGDPVFEPGDRLEISFSDGDPVVLTVPRILPCTTLKGNPFTAWTAGSVLRVTRGEGNNVQTVVSRADADGFYRVDVSGMGSRLPGGPSNAWGYVILDSGSGSEFDLPWSMATLNISLGSGTLAGPAPAGRRVHVEIQDGRKSFLADAETVADAQGGLYVPRSQWQTPLHDRIGRAVSLEPGQQLHIDVGDDQLDLEVPELLGALSLGDNAVVGHAPAGTTVAISFNRPFTTSSAKETVRADRHGMFSTSAGPEWTIRSGDLAYLEFTTSSGHRVSLKLVNPNIEEDLNKSSLTGYLAPGSRGFVYLSRPSRPLEWRAVIPDRRGSYSVDFADSAAFNTLIPAHSRLRVVSGTLAGEVLVSTRVPTLTLQVDREARTMNGLARSDNLLVTGPSTHPAIRPRP